MPQRTEYLTVPEVMAYLRLGRTTVYAQARLYLSTGGEQGLPCRRFGRSLRFPLDELAGFTGSPAGHEPGPTATRGRLSAPPTRSRPSSRPSQSRRTASTPADDTVVQAALPFTD